MRSQREWYSSALVEEKGVAGNTRKALTNIDVSLPCVHESISWLKIEIKQQEENII